MESPRAETHLPAFVTEDYVALLRASVMLAWTGVAVMLGAETWVHLSGEAWPTVGGFSTSYNLVLVEFALIAGCLSVMVAWRSWFERVPRTAIERLRTLLVAVVLWLGLHQFVLFHVSGAAHGPMLAALPVAMTAAFLALPAAGAWAAALYLLAGHAAVILMERCGALPQPGLLAGSFQLGGALGAATIALALAFAVVLGRTARARMNDAGVNLNRSSRHNPLTGLYEHEFLLERLGSELSRLRRHGGPLTFMMLELEGFSEFTAARGYDESRRVLRRIAQILIANTRVKMDTPAHYAPTTLAILLPDTSTEHAQIVSKRIDEALAQAAGGALRLRTGVTSLAPGSAVMPDALVATTVAALKAGTARAI